MKITFLGNSLVHGVYGGNFVAGVAERLPEHTIINAGISGSTIFNLLARLDDVLADDPDGVFILSGGNDAISYAQPATRPYYEQVQKVAGGVVEPDAFSTAYRDLLTQLRAAHKQIWVALSPMEYNPATQQAMREYNALAREAADIYKIPVLDLMERLAPVSVPERPPLNQTTINLIGTRMRSGWQDYETEQKRGGYTYSFDGIHLMPQTAERVAAWVVEFLNL